MGRYSNEDRITQCLYNIQTITIDYKTPNLIDTIKKKNVDAIIISGSHLRINRNRKILDSRILSLNIPVLGICFGWQWIAYTLTEIKTIDSYPNKEFKIYNKKLEIKTPFKIRPCIYKFGHHDFVTKIPVGWTESIKHQKSKQIWVAFDNKNKHMGVQFHPENLCSSSTAFFKGWLKWINLKSKK